MSHVQPLTAAIRTPLGNRRRKPPLPRQEFRVASRYRSA
jgi:hypothetical protein